MIAIIIKDLQLYDSLKDVIILNMDTIFKFRNSKHFVFHSYSNGDTATVQEDENSYRFYYNYDTGPNSQQLVDEMSVENMPAFIYPSVDIIFKRLGNDKIRGFTLWIDSTIEISVKKLRKDDIDVSHTLIWKRFFSKNTDPELFFKDTLIAPKWTYGIWVDEEQGW